MGCQSDVILGNNLTFSITTHDPTTAEATVADSAPIYRVYEEGNSTPILTGTMSLLDAGNTTAFYVAQIACTALNGFEAEKSYEIYIEATVNGYTGTITYAFKARDTYPSSLISWTQPAVICEETSAAHISRYRGNTWTISITDLGDISARTKLWFSVKEFEHESDSNALVRVEETAGLEIINRETPADSGYGDITVDDETNGDITITVHGIATAELSPYKNIVYDVKVLIASNPLTKVDGTFTILPDVTRAVS